MPAKIKVLSNSADLFRDRAEAGILLEMPCRAQNLPKPWSLEYPGAALS
jgi:hypothetical protein